MSWSVWQVYSGYIAGALVPVATAAYAIAIVRRQIVPARSTWIVWLLLSVMTAATMYAADSLNYQVKGAVFADTVIVLLALKFGQWTGAKVDGVCLLLALAAILLWYVTSNPVVGLAITLMATVVGFIPLAVALWREPANERVLPWAIMVASTLFQFVAIKEWSFATAAQPVLYMVMPFAIFTLMYRKRIEQFLR